MTEEAINAFPPTSRATIRVDSMMTGILAARRMLGEDADPWSVNAEGEYLEEKTEKTSS